VDAPPFRAIVDGEWNFFIIYSDAFSENLSLVRSNQNSSVQKQGAKVFLLRHIDKQGDIV